MARRALFLDRDGVINRDHGYVSKPEEFEWIPGIIGLVQTAASLDMIVVVVTNQAGIARGRYTEDDFQAMTDWMVAQFAAAGAPIAAVYYCPYHADGIGKYKVADHPDRKPNPGMILRAAADLDIDLSRSVLVGDKEWDIEAARRAGVGASCLFSPIAARATHATVQLADHASVAKWLIASQRA